ncbi:GNAT family N-acetyltransferase [uncultured Paludibaculum sp.]|uniref:GNAT family N-acetyltransferase n=1 Tax=uncultured Paludibaculum sp. TaxID=1765020 RepID=UPI002AAAEA51|nr:GNAT family N-acetyltransferase [uncultured Paludibaculum sp.]
METERLLLLPWRFEDEPLFAPIATDPEVMRHLTGGVPWTSEQMQGFIAKQIALHDELGLCRWRLQRKDTGETIGFTGVGRLTDVEDLELGWWLGRAHWGQGYATEAGRAALRDAFERCGLTRVISITVPQNLPSQRVMRRLGLLPRGRMVYAGKEQVVFGTTRDEWRASPDSDGAGHAG